MTAVLDEREKAVLLADCTDLRDLLAGILTCPGLHPDAASSAALAFEALVDPLQPPPPWQAAAVTDPDAALRAAQAAPDDVSAQLAAADVEVLSDRVDDAIARLVGLVRRTAGDEREAVRTRLLELFAVLDPEDPRVLTGRRALANALF